MTFDIVERFVAVGRGPDGRLDRDRLAVAVRHGFRIVPWQLNGAQVTGSESAR